MPNKVLSSDLEPSRNFYADDAILRHFLQKTLSEEAYTALEPKLHYTGWVAAVEMDALSMTADKHPPRHVKRDFYGETIDRIEFHPAYDRLKAIAVRTGMFTMKWEPEWRARFAGWRHRMGFGVGFLYAMSEGGLYCPLCMTDGVALLIDRYCTAEDSRRLLPRIYTQNPDELYTGAMFLTEKAGGSDVGANLCRAEPQGEGYYRLYGEKWFCSNADAQLAFALARTDPEQPGTKGLGIFLIERPLPDGSPNPMNLVRLKDKLGVRSMASGEYLLDGVLGKLVGGATEGFKIMADMINLSRLYNSVTAVALARRALTEAYTFLKHRNTFGKNALQHALVRTKLEELQALYLANFYMCWHTIACMDAAEAGDAAAAERLRLLTPLLKRGSAQDAVYIIRESMELMGGMGYIEDGVMPKLLRDALVLPIWEGAGNIMLLDVLRVLLKSPRALQALRREALSWEGNMYLSSEFDALQNVFNQAVNTSTDRLEACMRPWAEQLTRVYQTALLLHYTDYQSRAWTLPALAVLQSHFHNELPEPPALDDLERMLAWGKG